MGVGSRLKKTVKKVGKSLKVDNWDNIQKNIWTVGLYGKGSAIADVASAVADVPSTVKDAVVKGYHDIEGHTAKAREEAKANRQIAENKTLAAANADVSRDAADIVLGETSDTGGESLSELRKKRTSALSTQLGIS